MLQAFENFLKNNPGAKENSHLYLIGHHQHHQNWLNHYDNHPNIDVLTYLEYKVVQKLENTVSANIILEAISEISPFLPGKFPNCVIADKPIIILGPYYSEVRRLLGNDYLYWAEANDEKGIEKIITTLYQIWKNHPENLKLNRKDLVDYSTENYLKSTLENLNWHGAN